MSSSGIVRTADMTRNASGDWTFGITEPYALEGLKMELHGGETRLTMLGIDAAADMGEGAVSAARAIAAAYDAAVNQQGSFTATDNGYTLSGTCELGAYTAELGMDGAPVKLSSDTAGFTVVLSDFAQLPPSEIEAELIE